MASFFTRLFGAATAAPERKISRAAPLLALYMQGRPVWSPRDAHALAEAGFRRNAIAHRCVRLLAEAAAGLPMVLLDGREELHEHPLLDLLGRPNPRQAGQAFLEQLYGHLLISGNAYVEAVSIDGVPRELYALRPDRMRVVPGPDGWPEAYDYTVSGQSVRYRQDGPGLPPILQLMLADPIDDHYGFPPLAAAQAALETHNAASQWNKALLDNAARPSGALVYNADGGNMTDEQFARLKEELEANFQGAANAGRPLLLEGGLDWKPLSLSPKDMDFQETKAASAREIALAFGIPPLLLGLPGDNTHSNYAEANRAFWRSTVIPLVNRTATSLLHWLAPVYGSSLSFAPDLDHIEALASERESLWRRVSAADFLSPDEKREAVGYGKGRGGAGGVASGKLFADGLERRYNEFHVPRGHGEESGRFTDREGAGQGGAIQLAQDLRPNRFQIDLLEEKARGGHGIETHVNVSSEKLLQNVRADQMTLRQRNPENEVYTNMISGSFPSIQAAEKLINSTLFQNHDKIVNFLNSDEYKIRVNSEFASITGMEAYASSPYSEARIRMTHGAEALLVKDRRAKNGFTVLTIYPKY